MPYSRVAIGMMAHAVIHLYRNGDDRATRLIHTLAHRQQYRSQVVLNWITQRAAEFSHDPMAVYYDSDDIEEFIGRARHGTPAFGVRRKAGRDFFKEWKI